MTAGADLNGRSPFPPIASYGFLSDCHVTALVAPSGNVEWMCLPRMDGPSVFAAMLDRDAGGFRVSPADVNVPAARRYLPGTNILETDWMTPTGWLVVRDLLVVGPWHHEKVGESGHRRPPTDYDAEHVLLRLIECVQGSVDVRLVCDPVFDYGRSRAQWEYAGEGLGEAVARCSDSDDTLRLTTDMRLGFEGSRCMARTSMRDGDRHFAALCWDDGTPPRDYEEAAAQLQATADYWREWLDKGEFPDHPWRVYLQRSALTLKGLTYAPTGALCAAATTSLPETPRGERNWDYRYTWIRDATFTLWALYTLGLDEEANDFFSFVTDSAGDGVLQIMYGIGGETELEESELEHLAGYDGARPVRVGNAAYKQEQHDVWGAAIDSVYLHIKSRDMMSEELWPLLQRQVEAALAHWGKPDRGLWEVRGELRHFTSSKVMCWVAADRGARLARLREDEETARRWEAAAHEIREDICANAVDGRGVFTAYYGSDALDASCLLMPLVRFLPPDDERLRATVLAVADELTVDGLVLRYRPEEVDDGVPGSEGTFTICSFWLVSALAEIGETRRARELCEKILNYASPLGLYSEEIDPRSGRHLGNFPQAFTHLALINAVMHIIRAEEQEDPSRFEPARLTA